MNKKLLIAGAIAMMSASALAQSVKVFDTGRKWDAQLNQLVEGRNLQQFTNKSIKTVTPQANVNVNVSVTDAAAVEAAVKAAGYEAEAITDELVIMTIPASYIRTLAERADVLYINAERQFRPLMFNVRPETGVEKVTSGEGLETPFTGKGVIIGVIDQGFEYGHPAFANRVVRWGANPNSGTFRTTAPAKDNYDNVGHATHVANIAGGSKVNNNDCYGIATGADFIFMSSSFTDNAVLSQARAIKKYAEENGQPWVINMSFGSLIGPHDGTRSYDQNMSKLSGEGGILVAAMGNEGGDKFHAYREFTEDDQTIYLYAKIDQTYNSDQIVLSQVWSTANDGQNHLTIKPCILSGSRLYEPTDAQARSVMTSGIDAYNKRQFAYYQSSATALASVLNVTGSSYKFLWKVTGNKGDSFHAWIDGSAYPSEFAANAGTYKANSGDAEYMVGEGAATIPTAVAVASYNAASSFKNITGGTYNVGVGVKGAISNFSSHGPLVGETTPKPAIAAPGGVIVSAFSKNATQFNNYADYQTERIMVDGKPYYYGMMNGTSMASPAAAGTIALWLEANPKLTYDNILEIFKATGRRDSYTGKGDENRWDAKSGFGKIDAYEGLKKALEMKKNTGIDEALNTEAPVSISKNNDAWRVLFNNNESYALLQVYSLNGQLVSSKYVDAPRCGSEAVIDLSGLTPGVYVFKVNTTATSTSRKLVVK